MPTLREYKDDPGYYIYARPPEVGNITYGIDPAAYPIFSELEYEHGSQVSWRVIGALKASELIETGDSGSTGDTLNASQVEGKPLEEDFGQFYELLLDRFTFSVDEQDSIASKLGIDPTDAESHFTDRLKRVLPELKTTHILNAEHPDETAIAGFIPEFFEPHTDAEYDLAIVVEDHRRKVPDPTGIEHIVYQQSTGYHVEVGTSSEITTEIRSEGIQHVSKFDPLIQDELGFDDPAPVETSITFSQG
ncbi:hypothetical protein RBH20_19665 [Haloarcula sp. H-GB4]|uniref:hypothetical protein n=1 Tax=Haloarcula sp. H-GB4 TaxID=3069755 RepID=UPI0027B0695F|nr:hypothetical protein [Haloarcula sp. H-GB4]MDQ2074748.1 hypothetical protein [Haloarcula sp. H-GB4]